MGPRQAVRGRAPGTLGAPAAQQTVLGEHGQLQRRRHETLAQGSRGEAQ